MCVRLEVSSKNLLVEGLSSLEIILCRPLWNLKILGLITQEQTYLLPEQIQGQTGILVSAQSVGIFLSFYNITLQAIGTAFVLLPLCLFLYVLLEGFMLASTLEQNKGEVPFWDKFMYRLYTKPNIKEGPYFYY